MVSTVALRASVVLVAGFAAACGARSEQHGTRPPLVVAEAPPEPERHEPADSPPNDAPPANVAANEPDPFVGAWTGTGVQNDGQRWPMLVTIESSNPGRCGHIEYPSIPCAADWFCIERSSDGELRAREEVTKGRERCIDGGTMQMRVLPDGSLNWAWQGSGVVAEATLTRSGR